MNDTASLTAWQPVFWEPVNGTGERLMVGVVHQFSGQFEGKRIIRDDVLDCLYGQHASNGARRLIETSLDMMAAAANAAGLGAVATPIMGLCPGEIRATEASTVGELLRTAALLYSSLSSLDKLDELEESDVAAPEEVNKRFSTEVRDIVVSRRPDLAEGFGKGWPLIDGGQTVRFGYFSPRIVAHFGVLHPVRQSSCVRDARARLWEISRAMELASIRTGALIWAVARLDDATLTPRQQAQTKTNIEEIEQEAGPHAIRLLPVHTAQEGASKLLEYA